MAKYDDLVAALKALTQEDGQETVTLPVAEDEWYTRPDKVSYGIVSNDFETDALIGDGLKLDTGIGGSVDLFSLVRSGAGWVQLITDTLTTYCGPSWSLNSHTYERETNLFHWEWVFEI